MLNFFETKNMENIFQSLIEFFKLKEFEEKFKN